MPKTILGIRLAPAETLVVHLKLGWKGADVVGVERVERPEGDPEERGLALLEAGLPHADTVIAAVPGDAVFQRLVQLPFSDRSKVEQAAPLEAEESLPLSLEELVCHVHLLERKSRHSKVLLAAVSQEKVAELLDELRSGGLDPKIVDVEPLALAAVVHRSLPASRNALVIDLAPHLCQALVLGPEGPWSFHAFSAGSTDPALPEEVARYLASWEEEGFAPGAVHLSGPDASRQDLDEWRESLGLPVEILPFPTEGVSLSAEADVDWPTWAIPLGLALREGDARAASQINLLQGPFAPLRETGPWKQTAIRGGVYLAILLGLWGAGMWSQSSYKEAQYRKLKAAVREEFQRALPEVRNIVSEVDQMRARVAELEDKASILGSLVDREVSPLRILREISARLPKNLEVEFRKITVEEGRVRLEGITTSFDATDKIRADLAEYPRFRAIPAPIAKVAAEPGKVVFELTITVGQEG